MLTFTLILERFLVNLVQNIFTHERKGSLLLEYSQDFSGTNSSRRTVSGDVCEDSAYQGAKGIKYA